MAINGRSRANVVNLSALFILPLALAVTSLVFPRTTAAQDHRNVRLGAGASATAELAAAVPVVATSAGSAPVKGADREGVVLYLGQVIDWCRNIVVEQRLANEPAEILYIADDHQTATEVVREAFLYARAEAALLNDKKDTSPGSDVAATANGDESGGNSAGTALPNLNLSALIARRNQAEAKLNDARARLQDLQDRRAGSPESKNGGSNRQIVTAQDEIDLLQSRLDSINAMVEFETGSSGAGPAAAGLDEQIDQLEHSLPQAGVAASDGPQPGASVAAATTPLMRPPTPTGIIGRLESLVELREKELTLSDRTDETTRLLERVGRMRALLVQTLHEIDREASALTKSSNSNELAAINQNKAAFERLSAHRKLVVSALLPLSKQSILLNLYRENLKRWRGAGQQQFSETLHGLILRLFGLALLLGVVFTAAFLWRALVFRYVQDPQRRHQLLRLRRLALIIVASLVLIFDFANELGALATVMGFAAAGIALALQNVILSVAGYFYMSGRFGIRVGDRVEISGINGDVLEVGPFKLTLMELTHDGTARQPTGRIAVFPNSVVFQTNGNFFKQAPGASFTWREMRLTLAPECDYRLAEKRLLEVVNQVFARYRDTVQRECRRMETILNVSIETPRPQTRVLLSDSGFEIVIRYPAQTVAAAQTSDEISRRLVDAINRDPCLKLVAQATPAIQPMRQPQSDETLDEPSISSSASAT